jgi:predicted outer membrane repeat protein
VSNLADSGAGSLRQAVLDANGHPGANQVIFDSGLQGSIALTTGELDITNDLTITGPGASQIAISGSNASRVFNIAAGVTGEIDALTITQGRASQAGGINNAGSLTLSQCILSGNVATTSSGTGGGGGVLNRGRLTISNSSLSGNNAPDDLGGAIANFGTLAIDHSTLTQSAGWNGGAVYNLRGSSLVLSDSTVSSNSSGFGGGILNDSGTVTIARSILANNHSFIGGCIDSCLPAPGLGGAIANIGGTVTVDSSTVANNTAESGGGGIYTYTTLVVRNSTISGNTVNNGPYGYGGGIYVIYGGVSIANSTIAGNSASGRGGGIATEGAVPTARDTILADNQSASGPDLSTYLASLGYNVIGNTQGGCCFDPTDLLNVDPLLGPLQDHGGATATMALLPGSPALNAGDPNDLGTADQRGVVRSGGVNIGAFQASAAGFVLTARDTVSSGVPFDVTVTAVDPFGQAAVGYLGTVTFSTSDPDSGVVLPADYAFQLSDAGQVTFPGGVTLITPGTQTLTVADTADNTISGSANVTVTSAFAGAGQHGRGPLPPRPLDASPAPAEPGSRSEPAVPEVLALDRWMALFPAPDEVWLTVPGLRDPARGDMESWLGVSSAGKTS